MLMEDELYMGNGIEVGWNGSICAVEDDPSSDQAAITVGTEHNLDSRKELQENL